MEAIQFFGLFFILLLARGAMAATPKKPVTLPFDNNFMASWGVDHIKQFDGGRQTNLLLNKQHGAGFESKGAYLFGHFSMQIKLVQGDSAGTVTAFYLSSQTAEHDEIDFEFLGNKSGKPYILQTNVFTGGKGFREHRIYLWFDPTKDYHSYSVLWTKYQIVFFVDEIPIRVFKNCQDLGLGYPLNQPMKVHSSLWNGDKWATRGGWRKPTGPRRPSLPPSGNFMWMPARFLLCNRPAPLRRGSGGIKKISETWTGGNGDN